MNMWVYMCIGKVPRVKDKSRSCRVTWKLRGDRDSVREEEQDSPQPHLVTDSSQWQASPHLILGCPVVMFFNYVSLFNVAAAHPYLVNRCNFSCRVEMQPSQPGFKGQIELPQAQRERDLHLFLYSSGCNLSHNREIFSMPSNFQGKCEVWQFIHCMWNILFLSAL